MSHGLSLKDVLPGASCAGCGERQLGVATGFVLGPDVLQEPLVLCTACGDFAAASLQNKQWQRGSACPSREELTAEQVASFSTYPLDLLLNEMVTCTVRTQIGPLDADERRIAIAILERLAALGIVCKVHRAGCEIWPKYRLCDCPWLRSS